MAVTWGDIRQVMGAQNQLWTTMGGSPINDSDPLPDASILSVLGYLVGQLDFYERDQERRFAAQTPMTPALTPSEPVDEERDAIERENHPTAWERVLEGEDT